jgi:hypothetical protein
MKRLPRFLIILIAALGCIAANSAGAAPVEVVFDNTLNPSGAVFGPGCCQVGNEISLGGNARKIVLLSWLVDSQNEDIVAGIETQIYANDGPGGAPGTLLWQSDPLTFNVSATDTFLDVAVPGIIVPDVITVTSRILDSTPVALGRVNGGSPSVGGVVTSWIETSPGVWHQDFGPWGLRVLAIPASSTGRMTGGGTVGTSGVQHGFELHCDVTASPNHLEVNWGKNNKFHLESLNSAACLDDPSIAENPPAAGFDMYVGEGTGRYNGGSGYIITFEFTDAGEPGTSDTANITVLKPDRSVLITVSGKINNGNQQAHAQ